MTDYAPFPLIDLSGGPRERGRMHGKAAADRLRRGARMYAESLLKIGVDWKELERRAEAMVPLIDKFDPTYIEEMRGIAEGANEPFAAVVLMNARTEMVVAARKQQAGQALPRRLHGGPRAARGQRRRRAAARPELGLARRVRRDRRGAAHPPRRRARHPDLHRSGRARTLRPQLGRYRPHRQCAGMRPRLSARAGRAAALHPPQGAGGRPSRQRGADHRVDAQARLQPHGRAAIAAARPSASSARPTRPSGSRPIAASTSMPITGSPTRRAPR